MLWIKILFTVYFGLKVLVVTPARIIKNIDDYEEGAAFVQVIKSFFYGFFIVAIWVWL